MRRTFLTLLAAIVLASTALPAVAAPPRVVIRLFCPVARWWRNTSSTAFRSSTTGSRVSERLARAIHALSPLMRTLLPEAPLPEVDGKPASCVTSAEVPEDRVLWMWSSLWAG